MVYVYSMAKAFHKTPAEMLGVDEPFAAWTINARAFELGMKDDNRRAKEAARKWRK